MSPPPTRNFRASFQCDIKPPHAVKSAMAPSRHQFIRSALSGRIREIREERFGEDIESLADVLDIPARTWLNYEMGVTIPAEILLAFIEIIGVRSHWLLTGKGDKYAER
jgi:hypothetical protein